MNSLDTSKQAAWEKMQASSGRSMGSTSGGGGTTYDPMEPRVKALEDKFGRIDAKLDGIVKDVSEIKGRVNAMPTTWQTVGICASMLALAIAGGSFVFTIINASTH